MKIGNLDVYGVIYKITNKVNGKIYIGQTTQKNGFKSRYNFSGIGIERVYNSYIYHKNRGDYRHYNKHLLDSIEKYGIENFNVYECFDVAFSRYELDIKEVIYIKLFNCINNGYNTCEGGNDSVIKSGDSHYKSKYNSEQVYIAKQLYSKGEQPSYISNITGIDRNSLSVITSLNSWIDIGSEFNEIISEMQNIRKYRNEYNVFENEDVFREFYDKGVDAIDTCLALNLVDRDYYVNKKGRCSLKNYENTVKLFRIFKYRDRDKTRICKKCGEEYLLPLNRKTANNRKYCNKCRKI